MISARLGVQSRGQGREEYFSCKVSSNKIANGEAKSIVIDQAQMHLVAWCCRTAKIDMPRRVNV